MSHLCTALNDICFSLKTIYINSFFPLILLSLLGFDLTTFQSLEQNYQCSNPGRVKSGDESRGGCYRIYHRLARKSSQLYPNSSVYQKTRLQSFLILSTHTFLFPWRLNKVNSQVKVHLDELESENKCHQEQIPHFASFLLRCISFSSK